MGIPYSTCSSPPSRDTQAIALCSNSTICHGISLQGIMEPLSPSLVGLQLPNKMSLGICHPCQDRSPLKLAPAPKPWAFSKVLGTGDAKQMSSVPTGEEDIFPQGWAITTPSLAFSPPVMRSRRWSGRQG